jgi:steroid delta-isomerase
MKMMSTAIWMLGASLLLAHCASVSQHAGTSQRDQELLRQYVAESAAAVNRRDLKAMMATVSPDLILTYPGIADMGYEALENGYAEMIALPAGTSVTTAPTIEEIIVSGDLAVIRVTWTTTTVSGPSDRKVRRMRDMQVWRRNDQGEWKFTRGMHFREPAHP